MRPLVIRQRLMRLPQLSRRLLLGTIDMLLIPLSIWITFWLRTSELLDPQMLDSLWLFPVTWAVAMIIYYLSGQYRGLTRYVTSAAIYAVLVRNGLCVLLVFVSGLLLPFSMPPHSIWFLLWLVLSVLTGGVRFALRDLLVQASQPRQRHRPSVVIYGAGSAAAQLATSLKLANSHTVVAFLDDDPDLWRRELDRIPIYPPQRLAFLIEKHQVYQVLLAIPSLSRTMRRRVVDEIQQLGLNVLQVPSVEDITSGRARINTLRPISIEELLGRDAVTPDPQLLGPGISDQVLCITGAGGSIGSELCRQILHHKPKALVLYESSEPALYAIHQELQSCLPPGVALHAVLASAADSSRLEQVLAQHQVQVVFHAAAYKHVPLVEANPLAGLANNVFGTRAVCQAAARCGVAQLVLISTDKAVRPTNVMGATKRVAELVVQASAAQAAGGTRFAMVRFGNVLGSSGSVVPLFRQQIACGGPITITHPEIIRFFMTIPEAAQLVLQASVLAEGGDLFLLDMGEPVRIIDLARQMVRLSGLSLRDAINPDGDIAIECTGLRPGEKLYEELLIDADSQPTAHPLIYRAREQALAPELLWPQIDALEAAIQRHDVATALKVLAELVPEWTRGESKGMGA
jgi:FlaA1/EpsC-like NDP-sugar epimerase